MDPRIGTPSRDIGGPPSAQERYTLERAQAALAQGGPIVLVETAREQDKTLTLIREVLDTMIRIGWV